MTTQQKLEFTKLYCKTMNLMIEQYSTILKFKHTNPVSQIELESFKKEYIKHEEKAKDVANQWLQSSFNSLFKQHYQVIPQFELPVLDVYNAASNLYIELGGDKVVLDF